MKKQFKIFKGIFIIAIFANLLVSCGYEPVFYGIMHDVVPESATVSGNIATIARCTISSEEYLLVSGGGNLKYKKLSSAKHGEWKNYKNLPFSLHYYNYYPTSSTPEGHMGQQILRVIADKDNIYLLTANYKTDVDYGIVLPNEFFLWTCPLADFLNSKKTDWKNIAEGKKSLFPTKYNSTDGIFETYFSLFMTNTPNPAHRKAFFVTFPSTEGTEYYELTASEMSKIDSIETRGTFIATNENNTRRNSAFYVGDTLYFSDSIAVITNETATKNATYACIAGANDSYNSTVKLYLYDGNSLELHYEAGSTIASLAITGNSLLIGKGSYTSTYTTNGGIERILLDADGKPLKEKADFLNNAQYQFTSHYILMTILCADPTKNEEDACLYTAITFRGDASSTTATFSNIGLWSYYPTRGNWNRE